MADSHPNRSPSSPPSPQLCSYSDLLCEEDQSCFNAQHHRSRELEDNQWRLASDDDEEEEEYQAENMFGREAFFGFGSVSDQRCLPDRSDVLQWIFNMRDLFGFNFRTVYLSITFFDRFLSKRRIDTGKLWAVRLLAVACLSLAAKIEELESPMLTEFPIPDFHFESKVIRRMELLVLSALEWKMGSMTPFSYLNYFVGKLCSDEDRDGCPRALVTSSAAELILAMAKETNSMHHRPSVVAASSVLVASDAGLPRETIATKMGAIKFFSPLDTEGVHSCCELLREIEKRKQKTPQPSGASTSRVVLSLTQSAIKRRLTFSESDHSVPAKKPHGS